MSKCDGSVIKCDRICNNMSGSFYINFEWICYNAIGAESNCDRISSKLFGSV